MKLYSTNCPRCKVLEKKLNHRNINYEIVKDFDYSYLIEKGFNSAPVLELDDGRFMNFSDANFYINGLEYQR